MRRAGGRRTPSGPRSGATGRSLRAGRYGALHAASNARRLVAGATTVETTWLCSVTEADGSATSGEGLTIIGLAPVSTVTLALMPLRSQVNWPATWTLIVTMVLTGAFAASEIGIDSVELEKFGCEAITSGLPSVTPTPALVAVTVTFSAAMMPVLARVRRSVP